MSEVRRSSRVRNQKRETDAFKNVVKKTKITKRQLETSASSDNESESENESSEDSSGDENNNKMLMAQRIRMKIKQNKV